METKNEMRIKVSGKVRNYPAVFYFQLEGKFPPPSFESNGCSFSPDYWGKFAIYPACHLHDFYYDVENPEVKCWATRKEADEFLYRNIKKVLLQQGAGRLKAEFVANLYYGRVRIWGAKAFPFKEGEKPESFFRRIQEAWGLFKDKRNQKK